MNNHKDKRISFMQHLYRAKSLIRQHTITSLFIAWLLAANLSYLFLSNPLGWFITLAFFLCVPGYLLLRLLNRSNLEGLLALSFSVGLSILLLMAAGLLLNMTFIAGVRQPLSTPNVFIVLDAMSLMLIVFSKGRLKDMKLPVFKRPTLTASTVIILCTIMPILAAMGAIRLNNYASNILTLLLFALIATVFVWVASNSKLKNLFPYVLFSMAFAVLLSTSLRGWYNTGHDVQTEFLAFQLTAQKAHWSISTFRNAYNACLSITILPTIILKLTNISAIYVFKVVFQAIFAFSLIPIYLFMGKVSTKKVAFLGSFVFIALPAFLNDMPMLNRQEIGILFFALLMLAGFAKEAKLSSQARKLLIILLLIGLIFSHYSSMYIAIALLSIAGLVYWILRKIYNGDDENIHPLINVRLIVIAFLLTFCWNLQLTDTAHGFSTTVSSTLQSLFDRTGQQSNSVSYSLPWKQLQSPTELLNNYAKQTTSQVQYAGQPNLPATKLGDAMSHLISPETFNNILRAFSGKILQILLLVGVGVLMLRRRKKIASRESAYFLALALSCVVLLVLQTLLPQLSVDYGLLRFLQQLTVILGVPMVIGLLALIVWPNKKSIVAAVLLAVLFLDLSGFVPEILGGYPPQLALNNSGVYYEAYDIHKAELVSSSWLLANKRPGVPIEMDKYAQYRFLRPILLNNLDVVPLTSIIPNDYIYQDNANVTTNVYQVSINSNQIRYILTQDINSQKNLIYNDGGSKIYK